MWYDAVDFEILNKINLSFFERVKIRRNFTNTNCYVIANASLRSSAYKTTKSIIVPTGELVKRGLSQLHIEIICLFSCSLVIDRNILKSLKYCTEVIIGC